MNITVTITGREGEGKTVFARKLEALCKAELPAGSKVSCHSYQSDDALPSGQGHEEFSITVGVEE